MKKMLFLAALLVGTALLAVRDAHGGISFSTVNNNTSYYGDEDDNPLDNLRKLLKQLFTSEDPLDMPVPRYVPPPAPEPNPYAAPAGSNGGGRRISILPMVTLDRRPTLNQAAIPIREPTGMCPMVRWATPMPFPAITLCLLTGTNAEAKRV